MRWLIYGGNGWIGSKFLQLLVDDEVIVARARADIESDVKEEISKIRPDRVVCCIGRTHGPDCNTIDYIEDKLMINLRDNLYGPCVIASVCKQNDIHVTYIGTGCIFTYTDDKRVFTEDDEPNYFGSAYSIVKGFTDRMMKAYDNVLNARIRMPIAKEEHKRNFITKIVRYEKICSIQNSMTVLDDILPILIDMARKRVHGTYNITNPGTIEHNEVLELYRRYVDPNKTWKNFTIEEQRAILKADRSNNELDTTRITSLYPNLKPIKESVKDVMRSYMKIMDTKVYVLCYDEDSHRIAADNFSNMAFAEILRIDTTGWLENIMYKEWFLKNKSEWRALDYVGTVSYKALQKLPTLNIEASLHEAYQHNADVIGFYFGKKGTIVIDGERFHPGFTYIWNTWLEAMDIPSSISEIIIPFYSNYWLAKPEWMERYLEFYEYAVGVLMTHDKLKDLVWTDARYGGKLYWKNRCQEIFGRPYYPFYIFMIERLPVLYFTHKDAKILYARS